VRYIIKFLILVLWVMGIVIASGFWSTTAALFFPFWAFYLSIQKLMVFFLII